MYALAGEEVLPEGMTAVLSSTVKLVECNPRGMKRILNLLQIISVLGRIRPHDDLLSFAPIAFSQKEGKWNHFLNKCVLWIVLCQYFPYRVSLLVQMLLDFDQKIIFNAKASSMKGDCPNPPREFAYRNNSSEEPSLDEKMTIYSFYMLQVDKFVKALDKSDKFCRTDKDPEEFAALLQRTASFSDKNSITCEDVLGPKPIAVASTYTTAATISASTSAPDTAAGSLDDTSNSLSGSSESGVATETSSTTSSDAYIPASGHPSSDHGSATPSPGAGTASDANRDKTFSLLSYSFNLDPAIRNEVLFSG